MTLTDAQLRNAQQIVWAARERMPAGDEARAALLALMTTWPETGGLHNLASRASSQVDSQTYLNDGDAAGDLDSVGLFQQRPGWGDMHQRMTPRLTAHAFLRDLVTHAAWRTDPLGVVCQSVQRSAFPDRYAAAEGVARAAFAEVGSAEPRALYVGDSLAFGTAPYVPGVWRDARVGRPASAGLTVLGRHKALGPLPPLVVDLGTNDGPDPAAFRQLIDQVLALGAPRVLWLNTHRPGWAGLNGALLEASRADARLEVIDEATWSTAHSGYLAGDGIHYSTAGYAARSALVTEALAAQEAPMAHPTPDQWVAQLGAWGVPFTEYKSWRTHVKPGPFNPRAVCVHDSGDNGVDASAVEYDYTGEPVNPAKGAGPFYSTVVDDRGRAWLIGAGRSNHALGGDPSVTAAAYAGTLAGERTPGMAGDDPRADQTVKETMWAVCALFTGAGNVTTAQYAACVRVAAAYCDFMRWPAGRVVAHKELTNGRSDPSFPMATFRRDVQVALDAHGSTPTPAEDDMPYTEAQLDAIVQKAVTAAMPGVVTAAVKDATKVTYSPTWTTSLGGAMVLARDAELATRAEVLKVAAAVAADEATDAAVAAADKARDDVESAKVDAVLAALAAQGTGVGGGVTLADVKAVLVDVLLHGAQPGAATGA